MQQEENNNEFRSLGASYKNSEIIEEIKLNILKSLVYLDNETNLNIIKDNRELKEILFTIYNKVK